MKKAFSTLACQALGYKEVVELALQEGIHAFEVRLHKGNRFFDLPIEEVPGAMAYLESRGIVITDLATGVMICDYNKTAIEDGKYCVDLAIMTKSKGIRVFIGDFIKRFSDKASDNYEGIVKALKELCAYAEERNVEIWIETHNAFSEGRVLARLIKDVAYDNVKIIWDVMHPYEFGETPKETLAYLGDKIVHTHIKDGVRYEDTDLILCKCTKLGEGTVPIAEIISLLKDVGYDGYYSLEWESAWREEIRDTFKSLPELLRHFNDYMEKFGA